MPRYKYIDTNPKFLPVDLARQLLPGTFEHALNHLLDHEIDLGRFDARFRNDATGAPGYPPAVLLKVVLFAYARGIVSSRAIAGACTEHVTFIALCGDQAPHFTTIAHFVSTVGDEIAPVFAAVVAICDRQGLIGREMFAIDGVKLPSNASKQRSGTRAEFVRQAEKLEATAHSILQRHRAADASPVEPDLETKAAQRVVRLQHDAAEFRTWLAAHPDERRGPKGTVRQSNRTDHGRAKMATSTGVIQRYTGAATALCIATPRTTLHAVVAALPKRVRVTDHGHVPWRRDVGAIKLPESVMQRRVAQPRIALPLVGDRYPAVHPQLHCR